MCCTAVTCRDCVFQNDTSDFNFNKWALSCILFVWDDKRITHVSSSLQALQIEPRIVVLNSRHSDVSRFATEIHQPAFSRLLRHAARSCFCGWGVSIPSHGHHTGVNVNSVKIHCIHSNRQGQIWYTPTQQQSGKNLVQTDTATVRYKLGIDRQSNSQIHTWYRHTEQQSGTNLV